jgi:general secretion pathway protein L
MTRAEAIRITTTVASDLAAGLLRWGATLRRVLSLSLADERVARRRGVALLLEEGGLSVAVGSRFLSRLRVRLGRRVPLEEGSWPAPEAVAGAAALALGATGASRAEVALVIPKAWCMVRTAEFPVTVRENLADVVSFELDRLTPLAADRALYDFQELGDAEGRIRILLAVVKAEALQPYLAALQKRGIVVGRVSVALAALGTVSHFLHRKGNTAFVAVRPGRYEGGWMRDGRWAASIAGDFPAGGGETAVLRVAEAIDGLVEQMKAEGGAPPRVFVHLDAPGERWSDLRSAVGAPVRFLGESDLAPLALDPGVREGLSPEALGGLLECLWPGARGLDLLSKGSHPPKRTPRAPTAVLLVLLALLGLFWLVSPLTFADRKIEAIDREIASRRDEVLKIEAVRRDLDGVVKEIATIDSFKTSRPMKLNLIREITKVLPKTAWLSRLRITDTALEVEGFASSATEILPRFEASPWLKKVEFAAPTSRDTRLNMDRFSIRMEMEGLPEGRGGDEAKK